MPASRRRTDRQGNPNGDDSTGSRLFGILPRDEDSQPLLSPLPALSTSHPVSDTTSSEYKSNGNTGPRGLSLFDHHDQGDDGTPRFDHGSLFTNGNNLEHDSFSAAYDGGRHAAVMSFGRASGRGGMIGYGGVGSASLPGSRRVINRGSVHRQQLHDSFMSAPEVLSPQGLSLGSTEVQTYLYYQSAGLHGSDMFSPPATGPTHTAVGSLAQPSIQYPHENDPYLVMGSDGAFFNGSQAQANLPNYNHAHVHDQNNLNNNHNRQPQQQQQQQNISEHWFPHGLRGNKFRIRVLCIDGSEVDLMALISFEIDRSEFLAEAARFMKYFDRPVPKRMRSGEAKRYVTLRVVSTEYHTFETKLNIGVVEKLPDPFVQLRLSPQGLIKLGLLDPVYYRAETGGGDGDGGYGDGDGGRYRQGQPPSDAEQPEPPPESLNTRARLVVRPGPSDGDVRTREAA